MNTESKTEIGLSNLPTELVVLIAEFCSLRDGINLGLCCKTFATALIREPDQSTDWFYAVLCIRSFAQCSRATPSSVAGTIVDNDPRLFGCGLCADVIEVNGRILAGLIPRAFKKNRTALPALLQVEEDRVAQCKKLLSTALSGDELYLLEEDKWWLPPPIAPEVVRELVAEAQAVEPPAANSYQTSSNWLQFVTTSIEDRRKLVQERKPKTTQQTPEESEAAGQLQEGFKFPLSFSSWKDCYEAHKAAEAELDQLIKDLQRVPDYIIPEEKVRSLCTRMVEILKDEPVVLPLSAPLVIIGDVHGQFANLLEIFKLVGTPGAQVNALFLGDLANKGIHSIPCMMLLYALKIKYPKAIHFLRGASDFPWASYMGLDGELGHLYGDSNINASIFSVYDHLPSAAVIDEKIFAVHSGFSADISKVSELMLVSKTSQLGPVYQLTHNMPMDANDVSSDPTEEWRSWGRGDYYFSPTYTARFLEQNQLSFVIRGCSCQMEGYQWQHDNKILSVFSAANYAYRAANQGAVAILHADHEITMKVFDAVDEFPQAGEKEVTLTPYFI